MGRATAEQSNALSIFWLKKQGVLENECYSGTVTWTYGYSENKSIIGYTLVKNSDNGDYIQLRYTSTDRWSNDKSEMDYKVPLVTTDCNYGGKRYWFKCCLSKNGVYCGQRVGVLYQIGKYWGCRHCGNIAYADQSQSKKWRGMVCIPDVEKAEAEVKRKYYNRKMTKKYKRYLNLESKFEMHFFKVAGSLGLDN